ncbi:MAG: lamin tail domain-containing protein [Parabacteroides sp.]|nr:lamin tail domain-containing protein [Parabacteroides sp.]
MKQFILLIFILLPFCLFSQIHETFDESKLNSSWIGKERDLFHVNKAGQLQLNIIPTTAGKASIGIPIPYASTMQWEFDVHMQYAPSDENKLYVYLYQEDSDHYYYIRLGYDGRYKLGFRKQGNIDLFERKENPYQEVPILLHLKMTLENNEKWTLYSRIEGMNGYKEEGSVISPIKNPQESGNLIFTIFYTKSRSNLFSIDNVSVTDQITETPLFHPETSLPQLVEILPLSPSILRFTFDDAVEIKGSTFTISDIGDAYQKSYVDEETKLSVNALFEKEMELGKEYTFSYSGVTSIAGDLLPDYSVDLTFKTEEESENDKEDEGEKEEGGTTAYSQGVIKINEIMADPKGLIELPETEYVELFNTSDESISLSGWQFVYGGSSKLIGAFTIPAKGYAVLYRTGREISIDASAISVPLDNFPNALANAGKELQLIDPTGNLIDQVTYAKATAGKSWEQADGVWYLCTDTRGGTPGAINSSCEKNEEEDPIEPDIPDEPEDPVVPDKPEETVPIDTIMPGEIILNELLPNPYVGGSEYIELYNRSEKTLSVAKLSLAIRKSDGTLNTRYPLSAVTESIEAGGYVLLTKQVESVTAFYDIFNPSALWQLPKLPVLANTASTLVLFRTDDGEVIDELSYSSKWHAYSIKDEKGVALERIDPNRETQNRENWTSAAESVGYGTPGYQNSQYMNNRDEKPTGIEKPVWMYETGDYRIAYWLDRPGYYCRAYVFNTSGIRVAEVLNHALLGTKGELVWDGASLTGSPLHPGVYIFYAEIYHEEGGVVKQCKKVFLVR